jgi:hypothetical protein
MGVRGPDGPPGDPGQPAEKTAILRLSDGRNVGLIAQECRDVIFEDILTLVLAPHTTQARADVCEVFLRTLQPGTLRLLSILPGHPVHGLHGKIIGDSIHLRLHAQPVPVLLTITVQGIRRGHQHASLRQWTPAQAAHNDAFYRSFHAA